MRALIQRVTGASVTVAGETVGSIGKGYLILLGVTEHDGSAEVVQLVDKITKLRIFADADGKTNLSLRDVGGAMLVISQFTLCADCRRGTRPSFSHAAPPDTANALYEEFLAACSAEGFAVAHGIFGAEMQVQLTNDGPFTVWLDTDDLNRPRHG